MKIKNYLIIGIVALTALFGFFLLISSTENVEQTSNNQLVPITSITHGHGLSVDVEDSNKVYIATHHGLLLLINDKDLYQVGEKKDDYMGFSPHPSNPKVFFSSGHPSTGGNIGFQKSEDGGFSWKKVSNGVDGPVDFHAMTVSPVNPDLIFGWYRGALQRTTDGGKNWEIVNNTSFPIVALAADSDENIVYATSPQGLFKSSNKGQDWERLLEGFVAAITVNPKGSQILLISSEKLGVGKSLDGGKTWQKINEGFNKETPLFIAFYKQNPETVYLLTEKNSVYKSVDGGNKWTKIR